MSKQYQAFKETVKHMSKEDLIRQLYLAVNTPKVDPVPTIKPGDNTTKIKFNCRECDFECVVQYDSDVFDDIDEGHCPHCGNTDAVDLEVVKDE